MKFDELKPGMKIKFKRSNTGLASRPIRTDENEGCSFGGVGVVKEVYANHALIDKDGRKFSVSRADMICGCAKVVSA